MLARFGPAAFYFSPILAIAEQSQLQSDIEQSQRELHRQFPFRKLTAYVHLVLGYVSRWGLLGA